MAFVVPEAVDLARKRPHGWRFADQFRYRRTRAQFVLELVVAADEAASIDRLANGRLDPVKIIERLFEIVEGPSPDAAHGALDTAMTGHHDDLDFGTHALDLLEQFESADRSEQEVHEHHV